MGSGRQCVQATPHRSLRGFPTQQWLHVARVLVLPHDTLEYISRTGSVAKGM